MANSSCWWASRRTACLWSPPVDRRGSFAVGCAHSSAAPLRDAAEDSGTGLQKIHGCSPDPHQDREGSTSGAAAFGRRQKENYLCRPRDGGDPVAWYEPGTLFTDETGHMVY